jgi:RNA polymerase sigma-70 factor (ECF subfamily)
MNRPDDLELRSDEELMELLAGGRSEAFDLLVRRHQSSIRRLAMRYTGSELDAEDIAQEAFLRVWRAARSYKKKALFKTWLYRIVINLCLSLRRKAKAELNPDLDRVVIEAPSVEERLLEREKDALIAMAVRGLPERERIVLILHRFEGLSYQEVARVTGLSLSAVASLLHRAYERLKDRLGKYLKG